MADIVTEQISEATSDTCRRIKGMGYSPGNRIRIYGEKFDVLSDPFPEETGIAIRVKQVRDGVIRVLRLPATLLQSTRKIKPKQWKLAS